VAGLLAPFAEGFRAELLGQGYTQGSAAYQVHLMAHLSRWLEAQGWSRQRWMNVLPAILLLLAARWYSARRSARALMPLLGYLRALGWRRRGCRSRRFRVTG
jgi:hypothetical protein